MARSTTGEIQLKMQTTIRNIMLDGSPASSVVGGQVFRQTFGDGIGENQINRAWQKKAISIADGGFRDFNISTMAGEDIGAGSGNDALGQSCDFEEIVWLCVVNREGPGVLEIQTPAPAAANTVWIPAGYASNANGGGIREGGLRFWYEPSEVGLDLSPGSSSVLRLSAAAGQGDVNQAELYVFGRNDDDGSSDSSVSSASSSSSAPSGG